MSLIQRLGFCAILLTNPALVAQSNPSGAVIMEKYIEATGGRAAYAKLHSMVMKGSVEMAPMGLKGALTISKAEPNLNLMEMEFKGLGRMTSGFDGKVAWAFSAMQGPQIKEGDEKASAILDAHFHSENWKEEYKEIQNLGTETIHGKQCYKLKMIPHQGKPRIDYYEAKTWLVVKGFTTETTAMGEVQIETILDNWRTEEGVLMPHKIVVKTVGQTMTIIVESIQINTPLLRECFDPPTEIKALVNNK